jgi:hypothetical protein
MDDTQLTALRDLASDFRRAIERSRAERASPQLPYFPEGACRLVSRLFALHLARRSAASVGAVRFVSGHVPGCEPYVRHTWLELDGAVVDLTADPFGEPAVVVGPPTRFHASLDAREEADGAAEVARFTTEESDRYRRLLGPIEARLPGCEMLE